MVATSNITVVLSQLILKWRIGLLKHGGEAPLPRAAFV
jgi:hypothetical protein